MKKNYFKNLMQVSLLLGAAFVISSCDDVIGQEDNPVASYVQWEAKTPKSIELTLGIASKETATVKAIAVSSVVIVYESENTEIVKIDPVTGTMTAVGVGETNVKAVVSGASSAGKSVFIPEEIKIPVVVKDGKAKLTRVQDEIVDFTANKDSVYDLKKLFTAYPEVGTEADKSAITFRLLGKNSKTYQSSGITNIASLNVNKLTIKDGPINDWNGKGKDITDTVYVAAKISGNTGSEFNYSDAKATEDTVMVVITKSIAYLNEKNERTILTADKYTNISEVLSDTKFDGTIKAGTYFVDTNIGSWVSSPKISGDVTFILQNNTNSNLTSIDDAKDSSTLNIFRQAVTNKSADVPGIIRIGWLGSYPDNTITNFKAINIYGADIQFRGNIAEVGEINVYNEAKLTTTRSDWASTYSGKILLKDGGKLTVAGGTVDIYGSGTDLNTGFAVIGDVEVSKGVFTASNSQYRAVKGNLTAGGKILIKESNDNNTWTAIEGTTSTSKYIKAQEKSNTWK